MNTKNLFSITAATVAVNFEGFVPSITTVNVAISRSNINDVVKMLNAFFESSCDDNRSVWHVTKVDNSYDWCVDDEGFDYPVYNGEDCDFGDCAVFFVADKDNGIILVLSTPGTPDGCSFAFKVCTDVAIDFVNHTCTITECDSDIRFTFQKREA